MKQLKIAPKLAEKWESFGLAVGLSLSQINEIKDNNINEDNMRAFCDVVMVWSTEQPTPFTWYNLSNVQKTKKQFGEE